MSTDSPPKTRLHPVGITITSSSYIPPTVPQPAMPTIKHEYVTSGYWPRKPDNQTFKVGDRVKIWNGAVKKVLAVKDKSAQVSGFGCWFSFDELEKVT